MARVKGCLVSATAVVALYGLAYGYGGVMSDAPPAEYPAHKRSYGNEGSRPGATMRIYSGVRREGGGATRDMGGPPSGGSMGGSSSGGR